MQTRPRPGSVLPDEASSPMARATALILLVIAALALLLTSLGQKPAATPPDPAREHQEQT